MLCEIMDKQTFREIILSPMMYGHPFTDKEIDIMYDHYMKPFSVYLSLMGSAAKSYELIDYPDPLPPAWKWPWIELDRSLIIRSWTVVKTTVAEEEKGDCYQIKDFLTELDEYEDIEKMPLEDALKEIEGYGYTIYEVTSGHWLLYNPEA